MTIKQKKPPAKPKGVETNAARKAKPTMPAKENRNVLPVSGTDEADIRKRLAEVYLLPNFNAARLALAYNPDRSLDLMDVAVQMREHAKAVNDGDLSQAEAMLINQAQSLQAIFTNFAERAQSQTGVAQIQTMLGLALKAQSQCRATLQTLVDVKYPRQATFIKQANIANQQQVNNGTPPAGKPSREEKTIQSNELLEAQHGERMDTGKTGKANGADPQLETVGAINRA